MSSKFILLVVGLLAISAIDFTASTKGIRNIAKQLHDKEKSFSFVSKSSEKATAHLRKRRSVDDDKEEDSSVSLDSGEAGDLMKFFISLAWQEGKQEMLADFLKEMTDSETNITVVGWQRVLGDDGKIEEIRALQFVIPPKPEDQPENVVPEDDDDDWLDENGNERVLPYQEIKEMREMFEPMEKIGVPASITLEEFSENGDQLGLLYLDKDELYVNYGDASIVNKTVIASSEDVSSFIASLKPTVLGKPAVLKYGVDGNFVAEQSHVRPHLLGSVIEDFDAPLEVLLESPQIISQIAAQYKQESIPKELGVQYNKQFPEYRWRVLADPSEYHVTRDVSVTLSYDNFDLDESSYHNYLVYGVKKQK